MLCNACPRKCNIDRSLAKRGFCGEGNDIRVARIAPHFFEEPPISGSRGSGTVFFCGCSLRCVFCQNRDISRQGGYGEAISEQKLYERILELQEIGVHNLNLVTPTHFVPQLIPMLERLKSTGDLKIPVVYNSSGYESTDTVKALDGLVDIYMPDFKYFSNELAMRYSSARDYCEVASSAITQMLAQRGKYRYLENEPDILASGVIVRHLVLPSHREDSKQVLSHLASILDPSDILISLMSQYTPDFAKDTPYKNLHRKVTSFEYSSVCDHATSLGFDGFMQAKSSAVADFTPDFK